MWLNKNLSLNNNLLILIIFSMLLIIPISFFRIGNDIGYGVDGLLYRYQATSYGVSCISIIEECNYILNKILIGKSAVIMGLWIIGSILYMAAFVVFVCNLFAKKKYLVFIIISGLIGSGFFVLISYFLKYGSLFINESGFGFPFGVPLIFFGAWYIFHTNVENRD
jgi:hypothetical protein